MNRKQRRSQKTNNSQQNSADEIPLARPPENTKREAKTLYELAAERQAALLKGAKTSGKPFNEKDVVNVAVGPNGKIKALDGNDLPHQLEDGNLTPWSDTMLSAVTLSALHFTLEALTVHQYADELDWMKIFWHTTLQAFPVLFLLIHFMHGHVVSIKTSQEVSDAIGGLKQLLFVVMANMTGCYLIRLTNAEGYMAVMKNAPSVGTLWVWSVIEMGLAGALVGVTGPLVYAWYYGYGIF